MSSGVLIPLVSCCVRAGFLEKKKAGTVKVYSTSINSQGSGYKFDIEEMKKSKAAKRQQARVCPSVSPSLEGMLAGFLLFSYHPLFFFHTASVSP